MPTFLRSEINHQTKKNYSASVANTVGGQVGISRKQCPAVYGGHMFSFFSVWSGARYFSFKSSIPEIVSFNHGLVECFVS